MVNFTDHIHKYWKKYLILFVLGIAAVFLIAYYREFTLSGYCDAFFVVGAAICLLGGLSVVSNFGAFDGFGYAGYYVFIGSRQGPEKKYEDYTDYTNNKREKRQKKKLNFLPYFIDGILFVIVAIILIILINNRL